MARWPWSASSWGSDAAAARLKPSGGGAWRLSRLEGDAGRARHGVQADGGVAAWVLQRGGGADGPDLGLIWAWPG
jgi:hypothetical protein